jgi:hypothetical protein
MPVFQTNDRNSNDRLRQAWVRTKEFLRLYSALPVNGDRRWARRGVRHRESYDRRGRALGSESPDGVMKEQDLRSAARFCAASDEPTQTDRRGDAPGLAVQSGAMTANPSFCA